MSNNDGSIAEDIVTTDGVGGVEAGIKGEPPASMKKPTKSPLKSLKVLKRIQNDFRNIKSEV